MAKLRNAIAVWLVFIVGTCAAAEPITLDWGVIRQLPRTEAEVVDAHRAAEAMSCEQVGPGEALEIADFKHRPVYRLEISGQVVPTEFEACRRTFLSLGANMLPQDQARLPFLSGGRILDTVNGNYIAVQVRIHRHGPNGAPHLYYKPYAAVAWYNNKQRAQEYNDMVRNSVRDIRSLGLYVKPGADADAAALRTLVMLSRNQVVTTPIDVAPPRTRSNYELGFVRAVPTAEGNLTLHTFATTEQRRNLNYLGPYREPANVEQCSIKSFICFTDFGFGNIMPTARASRSSIVRSLTTWPLAQLDEYSQKNWSSGAFDSLNELLDAIIAGKVPAP